jgi:hypothetical protein
MSKFEGKLLEANSIDNQLPPEQKHSSEAAAFIQR